MLSIAWWCWCIVCVASSNICKWFDRSSRRWRTPISRIARPSPRSAPQPRSSLSCPRSPRPCKCMSGAALLGIGTERSECPSTNEIASRWWCRRIYRNAFAMEGNYLIDVMTKWLAPLPNGALANSAIRFTILELLQRVRRATRNDCPSSDALTSVSHV